MNDGRHEKGQKSVECTKMKKEIRKRRSMEWRGGSVC